MQRPPVDPGANNNNAAVPVAAAAQNPPAPDPVKEAADKEAAAKKAAADKAAADKEKSRIDHERIALNREEFIASGQANTWIHSKTGEVDPNKPAIPLTKDMAAVAGVGDAPGMFLPGFYKKKGDVFYSLNWDGDNTLRVLHGKIENAVSFMASQGFTSINISWDAGHKITDKELKSVLAAIDTASKLKPPITITMGNSVMEKLDQMRHGVNESDVDFSNKILLAQQQLKEKCDAHSKTPEALEKEEIVRTRAAAKEKAEDLKPLKANVEKTQAEVDRLKREVPEPPPGPGVPEADDVRQARDAREAARVAKIDVAEKAHTEAVAALGNKEADHFFADVKEGPFVAEEVTEIKDLVAEIDAIGDGPETIVMRSELKGIVKEFAEASATQEANGVGKMEARAAAKEQVAAKIASVTAANQLDPAKAALITKMDTALNNMRDNPPQMAMQRPGGGGPAV